MDRFIYYLLFIYWRLIVQSTAQGHPGLFRHKFKCCTSWIQYKACTLHQRKTYKHNPKVSPFRYCSRKNMANKVRRCWLPLTISIWRFNNQIKKICKKWMDKKNCKKNLLNKCIKANTSALWQHMLHTYHQLKYSSPNLSNKQKDQSRTKKPIPFGKWRFREKEVRKMNQKQKRIRQKERPS